MDHVSGRRRGLTLNLCEWGWSETRLKVSRQQRPQASRSRATQQVSLDHVTRAMSAQKGAGERGSTRVVWYSNSNSRAEQDQDNSRARAREERRSTCASAAGERRG